MEKKRLSNPAFAVVRAASPLPLLGNKALFLSNTSAALLV